MNKDIVNFPKNTLDLGTKVLCSSGIKGIIYCINPNNKTYDIMSEQGTLYKNIKYNDVTPLK